jgi:hypothetical protein
MQADLVIIRGEGHEAQTLPHGATNQGGKTKEDDSLAVVLSGVV